MKCRQVQCCVNYLFRTSNHVFPVSALPLRKQGVMFVLFNVLWGKIRPHCARFWVLLIQDAADRGRDCRAVGIQSGNSVIVFMYGMLLYIIYLYCVCFSNVESPLWSFKINSTQTYYQKRKSLYENMINTTVPPKLLKNFTRN